MYVFRGCASLFHYAVCVSDPPISLHEEPHPLNTYPILIVSCLHTLYIIPGSGVNSNKFSFFDKGGNLNSITGF